MLSFKKKVIIFLLLYLKYHLSLLSSGYSNTSLTANLGSNSLKVEPGHYFLLIPYLLQSIDHFK